MNGGGADSSVPRALPPLAADAHKGDAGRLLVIAGSRAMPGAALLAVRAAQRAGAGLVKLAALDEGWLALNAVASPETLLADWSDAADAAKIAARLAQQFDHARVVGCGLSEGPRARACLDALATDPFAGALVLDADALNELARRPAEWRAGARAQVWTPHPGEAARLLGREVGGDEDSRIAAAREIARRSGAICVLKGRRTVIADTERIAINLTGNPGMATAGAGDVLAGILGAYLASTVSRGELPGRLFEAVRAAVHVHGLAGDLAARDRGERGLIASDLIEFLPAAQKEHARCSPPPC